MEWKAAKTDMDRRRSITMDDALRVSLLRLDTGASPPCRQDKTATAPTTTLRKRNHAAPELSHGQHQEDSAAIVMNLLQVWRLSSEIEMLAVIDE
jgi:hypothetical protein